MKILTVCQPWAWAIVQGIKVIENRSWPTRYRDPLLIHAGKSTKWLNTPQLPEAPGPTDLVFGAIIGGVEILDCIPVEQIQGERFASGPYCWILGNPWCLIHPLPLAGKLGLFEAPSSIAAAIGSQLPT